MEEQTAIVARQDALLTALRQQLDDVKTQVLPVGNHKHKSGVIVIDGLLGGC